MPPRFFTSPYKNILATPAKVCCPPPSLPLPPPADTVPPRHAQREGWYSELPVANSAASDASEVIATTGAHWIAQGSASGASLDQPLSACGALRGTQS